MVAGCSVAQSFGDSNELTRVFEMNACGGCIASKVQFSWIWSDIQASRLNRLMISNETRIVDWIGKIP